MLRTLLGLICCLASLSAYSWNAMGHQLVAQIAYDHLTPKAKQLCNQYNRALKPSFRGGDFVAAAIWMDYIRTKDIYWFDSLHYINTPFTKDQTPLVPIQQINAISGIKQAKEVLSSNRASQSDKGLALRILIHVVGDLHQPLHAAALVSQQHPQGDRGGNLFALGKNPVGNNLHQYWDRGAGAFLGKNKKQALQKKAHQLEKKWPCALANNQMSPKQWAKESHQLALSKAYTISAGTIPGKQYQLNAQQVAQKRVAFAGCRLAALLNDLTRIA